ncbi:Protein ccc1 [Metarhizium acridum]|uniref:Protein ccc1 n=1 Tax=Metarhizium acridum TaxID=92637 RepID=UPI001C6BB470|nr:Protein ccc1 [Metarhizium acridum]KAG8418666.1 Protein ccc1 [Metarhizium acridum]
MSTADYVHQSSTNTTSALSNRPSANNSTTTLIERHKISSGYMRDAIIGLADGLTVPFALTAGLSSIGSSKLVIIGGLAELFAGSISMGLGAYLATSTERKHYEIELDRERRQVTMSADQEEEIMVKIFEGYGIGRDELRPLARRLRSDADAWIQFMMDFELRLERPGQLKPWLSAMVMGLAYFLGGLIPMIPYFALAVKAALFVSIGVTAAMLTLFGFFKATSMGLARRAAAFSSAETLLIGGLAAAASYGIVKGVNSAIQVHPGV